MCEHAHCCICQRFTLNSLDVPWADGPNRCHDNGMELITACCDEIIHGLVLGSAVMSWPSRVKWKQIVKLDSDFDAVTQCENDLPTMESIANVSRVDINKHIHVQQGLALRASG